MSDPAEESVAQAPERRRVSWTPERLAALSAAELRQLRENAQGLGEQDVAARCTEALGLRRHAADDGALPAAKAKASEKRRLVSRSVAFGMRGVALANRFWSRSGLTADGKVIFAMWAEDVTRDRAGARCLLWAPNVDGARPWADMPGGQERLEHCRRAIANGSASGFLVYGRRIPGVLPEERAATVDGIDAGSLVALRVERRGAEYWALWKSGAMASGA